MLTAKAIEVRDNFKKFCDAAYEGEPIFISRMGNKNVVLIGADDYAELMKLKMISEIEARVQSAEEDIRVGCIYSSEEARLCMREWRKG